MDSRAVGEINKPESEQQKSDSGARQPPQAKLPVLPLASELPSWDLTPADTLVVRRRPAK